MGGSRNIVAQRPDCPAFSMTYDVVGPANRLDRNEFDNNVRASELSRPASLGRVADRLS